MTWTDYKIPTIDIDTGDGAQRPVRGLGLEDIGALIVQNLDAMMDIATLFIQSQKDVFAVTNTTDLIVTASRSFPGFVSEVISIVTDTPELKGKKLPVSLQVMILQAAFKLTVQDAGGLGNLSAMLSDAVRASVAQRGEASQKLMEVLSPSSIGGAEKTQTS